ncbi:MAG: 2-C-methyl-D-erythritol 4-phosphate cytidylyltransferase [Lachnospiraceae bacterium]|nr:2-C-methyl-D-erythritol 4-phosphate cytidylyltransferase [Lachnospiraceae bacterium]
MKILNLLRKETSKVKTIAIVLAAGKGNRMKSDVPKQYMELEGYPILYYSLKAFEESFVDEIILVTRENDIAYCDKELVKRYGFNKIKKIVAGGKERYQSVYAGIKAIENADFVYIHDGARPFLTEDILHRIQAEVEQSHACVVGVPVKDTIKVLNHERIVKSTPDRSLLWQIQTPQTFSYNLVKSAYEGLERMKIKTQEITDDAMVVELVKCHPIKVVEGSYTNIKITTPEDLRIGSVIIKQIMEQDHIHS